MPVAGILGDQHAALFGQGCFASGQAKATYGTGCFIMMNTGATPTPSTSGLLTTVGYQLQGQPPVYALEGAVSVCGSLIQWLRDQLLLIQDATETEALAALREGAPHLPEPLGMTTTAATASRAAAKQAERSEAVPWLDP